MGAVRPPLSRDYTFTEGVARLHMSPGRTPGVLSEITCRCEAADCSRKLTDGDCQLVFRTEGGERRAYECDCGHLTVTVAAPGE